MTTPQADEQFVHVIPGQDTFNHVPCTWCDCAPTPDPEEPRVLVHKFLGNPGEKPAPVKEQDIFDPIPELTEGEKWELRFAQAVVFCWHFLTKGVTFYLAVFHQNFWAGVIFISAISFTLAEVSMFFEAVNDEK